MTTSCAGLLAEHAHASWEDFDALAWGVVVAAGLVAAWVIWKAVRYTLEPGETEADHIKRSILDDPADVGGGGAGAPAGLEVTVSSGKSGGAGARPRTPPGDGA
jgi:hypothetical protein